MRASVEMIVVEAKDAFIDINLSKIGRMFRCGSRNEPHVNFV
jgi:hypothetical protein